MNWFRKLLILVHRYLGIALSLLALMWFVSGIAMIYARGMPSLTPERRLQELPPLDLDSIRLTPSEAAARADLGDNVGGALLLTIMGRPAYRLGAFTVFADTGELLQELDAPKALQVAATFMNLPEDRVRHEGILSSPDQWTIVVGGYLPLHKIIVNDDVRTQIYVSPQFGEVVMLTTRGTRALAWIAAIPHWLYFAPLRLKGALWIQVVIWTSLLTAVSAVIGLILAVIQLRRTRPRIPYAGWLRWHYITGAIFGLFTLTWAFSGMLSVQPWDWAESGAGLGEGMSEALTGGPVELSQFPSMDATTWKNLMQERGIKDIKEVEFARIQGDPYYVVRSNTSEPMLVSVNPLQVRREPFSVESLLSRLKEPNPDVPIVESTLLTDYDSYYYDIDRRAPLPVLRVKFGDPHQTWFYVDPTMSQILTRYHRLGRVERWVYHGFHSLDFSFWYYNRPLWDIGIITLSLGGVALSLIGVIIAYKRLARGLARMLSRARS